MAEKYERIRNLREDSDLTQAQLGAKINVPQRTYAYYENGERMIPPQVLIALAQFYGVSVDYLLGLTDQKNSPPSQEMTTNGHPSRGVRTFLSHPHSDNPSPGEGNYFTCSIAPSYHTVGVGALDDPLYRALASHRRGEHRSSVPHLQYCTTLNLCGQPLAAPTFLPYPRTTP